jgi:tetratricopeptide (TPR) repeat protein
MSTKQIFFASGAIALLILVILGIIVLPKHATAPGNTSEATTTTATSTNYTVTVNNASTAVASTSTFDLNYWLQLGLTHKEAGDYADAIQAWTYAAQQDPTSYIAFYDLGDLYQNFDKNYPLAEENYLKVVSLSPTYVDAYRSLFTLYRYQYKVGTSAAANIVAEGLKNNPGNPDLLQLQAQLQSQSS